jgi:amino acid adenylation domain-containing protein
MRNQSKNIEAGKEAGLSPAKRALLAKWLREGPRANNNAPNGSILPHVQAGPVGLSFEQQRLWFFHQLEPGSPLYTMPIAARLSGVLQLPALRHALDTVAARHDILRTRYIGEDPTLVTDALRPMPMTLVDLRTIPAAERETEARQLLETEARRAFDLSQDLMMRATLVRTDQQEWILLILMHHIASDDWSWRVLCKEVAAVYDAAIAGRKIELPDLPIQYADFAVWQRQWLRGPVLENLLSYWRQRLAGAPEVIGLATDHPRAATQTFRGACEWLELPRVLNEQVNTFSQRVGATPFMILLAAFQTLLHRYCGQEDLIVGSPVAGRTMTSVESLIGVFINLLVLRADLSDNPTFNDLLQSVQKDALEALAHQELPFERLVQELQPQRSASHSPLFQVMFALQDELSESLRLSGLTISPFQVDTATAKFDLTLTIVQSATNLNCCAEYNTDLFERSTIRRMLRHYQRLLQAVLTQPEKRLSELPLLTEDERHQVLIQWNRTEADCPADKCVHDLFAARAAERPDAVALVHEGTQLTYDQLNRRSNQLAHHLRGLGVGPEWQVAVGMDRSLEMVVALLGILKAGGAYLPLDPSYPVERLNFMLKDSGTSLLLTRRSESSLSPETLSSDVRTVFLDSDWPRIAKEREDAPETAVTPENLAYVIYTSGSTGRPKGVQIVHRSVVNFLHSMAREPGLTHQDTLLSVTSISFDIAALEIFLPLSTGGRLVLAGANTVHDGAALARLLAHCRATVMQATPTLWRFLVDSGWTGDPRLKILCGGEALTRELADRLLDRGAELWNLYGPTETTIWSSLCKIERGKEPISIGRPIANTQIYLLDRYLEAVPSGFPGVLHIGGAGLARGYLNRPELTAEKFIPNPFGGDCWPRLYNTGDIARYRPDGSIECLGRSDSQVKLRGHRIDVGEIESTLRQHPGVREAVVILREDEPGQKGLAAYLIGDDAFALDSAELHSFLKTKLPDYMIPEAFAVLKEFPITPNGKVDRKALPVPMMDTPASEQNFVAPCTPIEEELAGIWREVMKRDTIGREDDFFAIGGHSLLAMMMISRVRQTLKATLTLRDIFEAPTVAGLAAILAQKDHRPANSPLAAGMPITSARATKELVGNGNGSRGDGIESVLNPMQKE